METDLSVLIKKRTEEVGKDYDFEEGKNHRLPAQHWFQNSIDGYTLFLVLYTQACRWSKCLGCNLPSKMSQYHVGYKDIMRQIDYVFDYILDETSKNDLRKVILSNNGSVLDEDTFSTTALVYFLAKMNMECPNISTLTLETRPEYVDMSELEVLSRVIHEGNTPTKIEIAIGFEIFDEELRNKHFFKGLSIKGFETLAKKCAQYKIGLKTYFMMKPIPGMTEEEGKQDIVDAINYLDEIATKFGLEINMHLNPTYVASGTPLVHAFKEGRYTPPLLDSVREVLIAAQNKKISIFVGLDDEGLAIKDGQCVREGDSDLVERLELFNKSQDFSLLLKK